MPTAPPLTLDRSGPSSDRPGGDPVVLVHAGIADRRMWDGVLGRLTRDHDVVRVDLRGFGETVDPPSDLLDHVGDLLDTLEALEVHRAHLVGASLGAGVVTEAALDQPGLAASLVLLTPGGSLIADWTPQLREFVTAERAALAAGDLDAATEVNLRWWVDGPGQPRDRVDGTVRALARTMQRTAFAIQAGWPTEPDEAESDPPVQERLTDLRVPVTVLTGGLDLDCIGVAAASVLEAVPGAHHVHWPFVAHLPAVEAPDDTAALIEEHLARVG